MEHRPFAGFCAFLSARGRRNGTGPGSVLLSVPAVSVVRQVSAVFLFDCCPHHYNRRLPVRRLACSVRCVVSFLTCWPVAHVTRPYCQAEASFQRRNSEKRRGSDGRSIHQDKTATTPIHSQASVFHFLKIDRVEKRKGRGLGAGEEMMDASISRCYVKVVTEIYRRILNCKCRPTTTTITRPSALGRQLSVCAIAMNSSKRQHVSI